MQSESGRPIGGTISRPRTTPTIRIAAQDDQRRHARPRRGVMMGIYRSWEHAPRDQSKPKVPAPFSDGAVAMSHRKHTFLFKAIEIMKKQNLTGGSVSRGPQSMTRRESFRDLIKQVALIGVALCFSLLVIPADWRFVYFLTSAFLMVIGVGVRMVQIIYPAKYEFTEIRHAIVNWYEKLDRRHQLYLNVTLCLPFLGYFYLLDEKKLFAPTAILFFIYCLGVAAYDVYRIYATIYGTLIGKGFIAIAFAIGSNLAFSISGKIIGEMTHVPPTTFPHTLSFLAIFATPFLFMAAGTIFIPVSVVIAPVIIYGSRFVTKTPRLMKWFLGIEFKSEEGRYIIATVIFQIIFYSAIGGVAPATFLFLLSRYNQQIELTIGKSIYEFDMYPGTECKMASGYHQASLGDENYVLASKQSTGITFESPRKCAL
ncbi:hypothetical protein [Burkholderia glumae]|uniref:hypothetical protein n=1 Tax=Burkholderia glumae TaxID=337 RepID=UPI001463DF0C|nr:hypothetical protein [Burkholderia glumae]QJP73405.1 hypothetical protein HJC54_25640 [Burkholderia glumae]